MDKRDPLIDQFNPVYRTAFESMNQGFCLLEKVAASADDPPDFRYLLINPAFGQHAGLHQVVGKTLRQVVPDLEEHILAAYNEVALTGKSVHFETYVSTLNRWIDTNAFRIGEHDPPQIAVLFADITERKKTEAVLQQNEQRQVFLLRLSDALRPLADPVAVQATVTRITLDYFGVDRSYYCEIDGDRVTIRRDAHRPDLVSVAASYSLSSMPIFKSFSQAGRPLVVADVYTTDVMDEELRQLCIQLRILAYINVPVIKQGQLVGNFCITQCTAREWTPLEIDLAQEIAERSWATVEQTRAEVALRESEKHLRLAIEATNMSTWEWNLVTNQVYWNEQHFLLLGLEPGLNPVDLDEFFRHLHPGERQRVMALLETAIAERSVYDAEFLAVRADGSQRYISSYGRVVEEVDGRPTRMSGVMFDVTERRLARETLYRSEARQRAILESAKDYAIFTTDLNRRVDSWNQGAQTVFGYSEADILHQYADRLFTPEDQQQGIPQYEVQKAINQGRAENERWHNRQDGSRFYGSGVVTPLRDESGTVVGLLKVMRDLTTQKRAEETLKEADQRKDEFLAMLAHELRNPMATIRNGLTILSLPGEQDSMTSQTVAMMSRQVDHLVRMVDDLLDVSRISRGKIELKSERVELGPLVTGAVDAIRHQYAVRQKQIHLGPLPAGLFLRGDATRLSQVITNLLTNGLRYTGEKGQVWVSLTAENGEAVLRVADNGIGLSADQLTTIFDLFVQIDNSSARSQGGLGVGLTLAKQLIEMHNGRLEGRSPGLGQGSEFTVYLPLLNEPRNEPNRSDKSAEDEPANKRILIIDDNTDAALTLSMLLKIKGYEVHSRHNGREGIQAAETFKPALVLCDIGMPGLDGYQTCRLIRQQSWGQAMTIVALTGYGQQEDRQRTREAGFDDHLVKPVDLAVLIQLLANLPLR